MEPKGLPDNLHDLWVVAQIVAQQVQISNSFSSFVGCTDFCKHVCAEAILAIPKAFRCGEEKCAVSILSDHGRFVGAAERIGPIVDEVLHLVRRP